MIFIDHHTDARQTLGKNWVEGNESRWASALTTFRKFTGSEPGPHKREGGDYKQCIRFMIGMLKFHSLFSVIFRDS